MVNSFSVSGSILYQLYQTLPLLCNSAPWNIIPLQWSRPYRGACWQNKLSAIECHASKVDHWFLLLAYSCLLLSAERLLDCPLHSIPIWINLQLNSSQLSEQRFWLIVSPLHTQHLTMYRVMNRHSTRPEESNKGHAFSTPPTPAGITILSISFLPVSRMHPFLSIVSLHNSHPPSLLLPHHVFPSLKHCRPLACQFLKWGDMISSCNGGFSLHRCSEHHR